MTTTAVRSSTGKAGERRINHGNAGGFTLIELIIVVAIIGILAMVAMPAVRNAPERTKEAVLKENLYQIRSCIDQHLADHGVYPESLQVLVDKGYLRRMPVDPILESDQWEEIPVDPETDEELQPADGAGGIIDVRSRAPGTALDGTNYSDW